MADQSSPIAGRDRLILEINHLRQERRALLQQLDKQSASLLANSQANKRMSAQLGAALGNADYWRDECNRLRRGLEKLQSMATQGLVPGPARVDIGSDFGASG